MITTVADASGTETTQAGSGTTTVDATVDLSYPIVDTGQVLFYDDSDEIEAPSMSESFFDQDAGYDSLQPSCTDNGDETVTDLNTGLTWQQDPGDKMTYAEAAAGADSFREEGLLVAGLVVAEQAQRSVISLWMGAATGWMRLSQASPTSRSNQTSRSGQRQDRDTRRYPRPTNPSAMRTPSSNLSLASQLHTQMDSSPKPSDP